MVKTSHNVNFHVSPISFDRSLQEKMRSTTKNSLNIESIALRLAHMGDDDVDDGISKMEKLYCFK